MNTKVIFNINNNVKDRAMRKAKKQGTTLSTVLNFAAKAYAEDRLEVDVLGPVVEHALQQVREGKVVSAKEVYRRLGIKIK